ncbi:extracellular solute-binding protein [Christensenella tenuis]|uniref:Extracellular solute-binding protein n=1 Tax=Christensenella tenuis TaxID=2763033 RepID=A0ABR7EF71_9FIRM|nr:extracellular solute-binding protein [Christensenella tenuis]MBC5647818.1 extracellular solute-binding protein [Christensenella tenuis]
MATIKDVAAAAGVSVGTVSNVLNGKTDNIDLIERVERTMQELGYRPDAKARSLKNTKSCTIGLVVPNLHQAEIAAMLSAVEERLEEMGYHLTVKNSKNNRVLERKYIEQLLEERADGIIVYPCGENGNYLKQLSGKEETPVVLVGNHVAKSDGNCVYIRYEKALARAFYRCRKEGVLPGMIFERGMIGEKELQDLHMSCFGQKAHLKLIDCSGEKGFRAAYTMLEQGADVGLLIAGNAAIAQGVRQAVRLRGRNLPVIAVKEQNWVEDEEHYCAVIHADYHKAGILAAEKAVFAAEADFPVQEPEFIEAEYRKTEPVSRPEAKRNATLRLCMFDCPVTDALRLMVDIYTKRTGVTLEIEALPYDELDGRLARIGREKSAEADVLMADIVWMNDMAKEGSLLALDHLQDGYTDGFLNVLITKYGTYHGLLYGLPFMSGALLLFYQKDLFEDVGLKRLYRRKYGCELLPPATWEEYNRTAEFFTREYNDRSPVPYGLAAIRGDNIYTTIGFLSRLWSYGGDVFCGGKICINSENALRALENFIESYRYVRKDKINYNYNDAERDFMSGECAMVVSYDSHAVNINDYSKSKVAGNIGCALIPGRRPVLGGWYLGVNPYSAHTEEAVRFLKWICGESAAVPFSFLGGTSLRKDCIEREDLAAIYPWKDLLSETYEISRMRTFPNGESGRGVQSAYNHIIGGELNRVLEGKQEAREALEKMEQKLRQL